jgi:hypothetical protein
VPGLLSNGLHERPLGTAVAFAKGVQGVQCGKQKRGFTGKLVRRADSEGGRSAFRTDVDHDSEVMSISVPN